MSEKEKTLEQELQELADKLSEVEGSEIDPSLRAQHDSLMQKLVEVGAVQFIKGEAKYEGMEGLHQVMRDVGDELREEHSRYQSAYSSQ